MFILFVNYVGNYCLVDSCKQTATNYYDQLSDLLAANIRDITRHANTNISHVLCGTYPPEQILWTGSTRPTEFDILHLYL